MMRVHIAEKFNTSFGIILLTDDTRKFTVGDKITCDDGNEYTIKGIQMGTKPDSMLGLIV